MYVPILKNWDSEMKALRMLKKAGILPCEGIVPFIKIVEEDDAPTSRNWYKSIEKLNEFFADKPVFADYHRCNLEDYRQVDMGKIGRIREMSAESKHYLDALNKLADRENLIPVISIRSDVENPSVETIISHMEEYRRRHPGKPFCLSIDTNPEKYSDVIEKMAETDYLFFDIGEKALPSQRIQLIKLKNLKPKAQTILLNSPRKRTIKNKEYETCGDTDLIDNSVRTEYQKLEFCGFGDFAGLRDDLKLNIKNRGFANASIFIYRNDINKFRVYVNPDSSRKVMGLRDISPRLQKDLPLLDPNGTCLALRQFREEWAKGNAGNFATWVTRTVIRYIQQIAENPH